jgi:hypothetical protein
MGDCPSAIFYFQSFLIFIFRRVSEEQNKIKRKSRHGTLVSLQEGRSSGSMSKQRGTFLPPPHQTKPQRYHSRLDLHNS